ncbi:MAG: SLC13 family permease [Xanthomonadales bacterium]|jgi:di/tricarboxylate transporter|nr:SLC13 family permease [Xanthomonadales bacterium]
MVFPDIPNAHALAVLLLTVLALFLFTRERIPLESTSLFVLVTLIIGFELLPFKGPFGEVGSRDFFHGFGHEALVSVCSLMIAGQGLVHTGALEPVARRLTQFWRRSPALALLATLLVGAVLSAFMNNTPIVVLMLPMLIGAAVRSQTPTSGILLPMGFATLIGGMGTTIGTSTNLLVVSVAADMGMQRFQMFDFLMPVVIAGGLGIVFLWLVAPRMIPRRHPPMSDISRRVYEAHLVIPEKNRYVGKKLARLLRKGGAELHVRRILRGKNIYITPLPDVRIHAGDKLLVSDTISQLHEFQALLGARLHTGDDLASGDRRDELQLAEVAVTLGSRLHRMKLGDVPLKEQYGLQVLALHNASGVLDYRSPGLHEHRLQASDVLLVQGSAEDISRLKMSGEMLVLDGTTNFPRTQKAPIALVIMLLIVALPALGILPIEASSLAGVMAMLGTRCLKWRDATNALSVQIILIIVASLALGSALMKTGGADWLALVFLSVTFGAPAWLILAGLMLLMAILTNIVSNNAAAVIGTPIAISIAMELGLPLEPFVLAVLFGANLSFVTPMAYKTNLLVMNAGGYKFMDFVKVGIPLTVIMWFALSAILSLSYDF